MSKALHAHFPAFLPVTPHLMFHVEQLALEITAVMPVEGV
jgi:hypothetical protein